MRRALGLGAVALAGVALAVWLLWGGSDTQPVLPSAQPVAAGSADGSALVEPEAGAVAEGPAEPQQAPVVAAAGSDPATDDAPCAACYDGVNLLEDRSADEIERVQAWSDADYTAAVEGLWAMHDGRQLDFSQARRADQALLVDRLLGTEISAQTRTALLDLHSEAQSTMAGSEKTPGWAPGVTAAMGAYEDGAAELLTDEQLDRLLNGRPVGD